MNKIEFAKKAVAFRKHYIEARSSLLANRIGMIFKDEDSGPVWECNETDIVMCNEVIDALTEVIWMNNFINITGRCPHCHQETQFDEDKGRWDCRCWVSDLTFDIAQCMI